LPRAEEADEIDRLISHDLKGKAIASKKERYARKWQWLPENSEKPLEIQMASSGQMSTWPLVYIAQALFGLGKENRPYFLHIEEPEAHLHPRAQIAVVKLLAYLANKGIHIVVTTHSLAVLYAFNNLSLAYRKLGNKEADNVPEVPVRLAPEKMSAYLFADGTAESIIDDEGQIDESLLGEVLGDLEVEFNRLTTYKVLWGKI
jgi:ABC-type cobalamin/Fe3+-siderophores transport system ATPase subunit